MDAPDHPGVVFTAADQPLSRSEYLLHPSGRIEFYTYREGDSDKHPFPFRVVKEGSPSPPATNIPDVTCILWGPKVWQGHRLEGRDDESQQATRSAGAADPNSKSPSVVIWLGRPLNNAPANGPHASTAAPTPLMSTAAPLALSAAPLASSAAPLTSAGQRRCPSPTCVSRSSSTTGIGDRLDGSDVAGGACDNIDTWLRMFSLDWPYKGLHAAAHQETCDHHPLEARRVLDGEKVERIWAWVDRSSTALPGTSRIAN
ncbi:hypothetical protein CYLTODRAFT_495434 [Cylindrobasidium torrendii FP15055 ss-10]|uniref:Uncharacterized protein n=1 Tax=Cylindrobasidium torrendii FP15055 ss-10 TaxID=1314674 RepID=A0A0D7AT57_9AGAR|nr:hypothetical protein CYLTODRAFT_495434 [Cylindrobasidium torrendii FP15055 ss-10]